MKTEVKPEKDEEAGGDGEGEAKVEEVKKEVSVLAERYQLQAPHSTL